MQAFRLEDDVDDYVKKELTKLGLMKNKDFKGEKKERLISKRVC